MIVAVCLAIGVALRVASGRDLQGLSSVSLRGEGALLGLLLAQLAVPALHLAGTSARVAFYVWLATFPAIVGAAWLNRRAPGMLALGAGLFLNFVVIAANGGMPVLVAAMQAARASLVVPGIPAGDFVHILVTGATRLPWLADVVALPGPSWFRAVVSPGDILLFVGVIAYVGRVGDRGGVMPVTENRCQQGQQHRFV